MKNHYVHYRVLIVIVFSYFSSMVAHATFTHSDQLARGDLTESIQSYQQAITVDCFTMVNLPQASSSMQHVERYKGQSAIQQRSSDSLQLDIREESTVRSAAPALSFQGLPDDMRVIPPDTTGAVGPNHVMTMLNDRVRIQTKTGTIISTVALEDFWNNDTAFNPQLLYDPYNNRWIAVVGIHSGQSSSGLLVAVSQTSDPTGEWYRFNINADPNSLLTVSYPRLGFNRKWIAVQANMLNSGNFDSSKIFLFNKAQLYAGFLGSVQVLHLNGLGGNQAPAITYDSDLPILYLVQSWNGNINGRGTLRLYAIEGDIGSATMHTIGYPSANRTWTSNASLTNGGFAPQLNSTARIDVGTVRISNVVYRNGSIWCTHMVFLPEGDPIRTGIQWWQINPTNAGVRQFGRIEDKSANKYLAYPSIGVNKCNDVVIGYSQFSPTIYPSAAYALRYGTDPSNTIQKSRIFKSGLGVYNKTFGSSRNRWGDYSSTVVDPNGLDLWTLQEYADTELDGESRWATWWAKIALVNNQCP